MPEQVSFLTYVLHLEMVSYWSLCFSIEQDRLLSIF